MTVTRGVIRSSIMSEIGLAAYRRCCAVGTTFHDRAAAYFAAERAARRNAAERASNINRLRDEEEKAFKLLDDIRRHATRIVGEVTPERLAQLYDERGWWPEFVCMEVGHDYTSQLDSEWREALRARQS